VTRKQWTRIPKTRINSAT